MCRRGNLSTYGTKFLLENGYKNVYNIEGGINEYRSKYDPSIPNF
jgi:rhodanese-related sulfurtransferase